MKRHCFVFQEPSKISCRRRSSHDGPVQAFASGIAAATGIGTIRSGPDLLDTVVYPSASFVPATRFTAWRRRVRPSTVSLMPDGFAENLSRQELSDLLAFLQSQKSRTVAAVRGN